MKTIEINKIFLAQNYIIKLLLLFIAFIQVIRFEANYGTYSDYCFYPDITNIELVINVQTNTNNFEYEKTCHNDNHYSNIYPLNLNKYFLGNFNDLINHQIKFLEYNYTPNHQITQFLQKSNIWHQSSTEDIFNI